MARNFDVNVGDSGQNVAVGEGIRQYIETNGRAWRERVTSELEKAGYVDSRQNDKISEHDLAIKIGFLSVLLVIIILFSVIWIRIDIQTERLIVLHNQQQTEIRLLWRQVDKLGDTYSDSQSWVEN